MAVNLEAMAGERGVDADVPPEVVNDTMACPATRIEEVKLRLDMMLKT